VIALSGMTIFEALKKRTAALDQRTFIHGR